MRGGAEGVDLPETLRVSWELGIRSILAEGGGRLAASLVREGIARRLYLFLAPLVFGAAGVPAFPGLDSPEAWGGWEPAFEPRRFGRDVLVTYDRRE